MRLAQGIAAAALFAVACASEAPPEPSVEAPEAEERRAAARLVTVRRPSDATLVEAPAVVRASPEAAGEVSTNFRARVERVHVRVGEVVAEDDPIVDVIAPEVVDAAATLTAVRRRLGVHRARAEELERLRAEGFVDSAQVFEQRTVVAELEATRDRAAATLRAAGVDPRRAATLARRGTLSLRAPVGGVVVSLDARPGEIREAGAAPFATIRGAGAVRVEARTSAPWPGGASARFEAAREEPLALGSSPLVSTLDPETGNYLHWFTPRDPRPLPDGLRGVVKLEAGEGVWEVPVGAVRRDEEGAHVMRVDSEGREERVRVEARAASGASALVEGSLEEGDRVAVEAGP